MHIFLLLCALLAPVALADPQPTPKQLPSGAAINIFIATPVFFVSSVMMSVPIAYVLIAPHHEMMQGHPALWALLLISLAGAWSAARLMSSWGEERKIIAVRAALLLGTDYAVQQYATNRHLYDATHTWNVVTVGFVVAAVCAGVWRIIDRAYYPLALLVFASLFVAFPFVVNAVHSDARARGFFERGSLLPDPAMSTYAQLVALLQLSVLAMAFCCIAVGIYRVFQWVRKGPKPPRRAMREWPPQMGQVWQAKANRDDGGGWKVRPVLIWDEPKDNLRYIEVLQFTSQDKTGDDRYIPVHQEEWTEQMGKRSWINLHVTRIPKENFRCWACACPQEAWDDALKAWRSNKVRPDTRNYNQRAPQKFFSMIRSLWGDVSTTYYAD
jgi:hypothetical protein